MNNTPHSDDREVFPRKNMRAFEEGMTQPMKDAPSYLDWTDEQLGKMTRALARDIQDTYGVDGTTLSAAVFLIVEQRLMLSTNSDTIRFVDSQGHRLTIQLN